MSMNLVSFSLYGHEEKYFAGALRNAEIVSGSMPGWIPIFFLDNNVPASFVKALEGLGSLVRIREPDWHQNGMFWRFRAFFEVGATRVLIRDSDSRINARDLCAIDCWVDSGLGAHIIRDHPLHQSLLMGGMWGAKSELLADHLLWNCINDFGVERGADQEFLNRHIYPVVKSRALIHDSFFLLELNSTKIPMSRHQGEFIGEVIDESDEFDQSSRDYLLRIENSFFRRLFLKFYVTLLFSFRRLKIYFRDQRAT